MLALLCVLGEGLWCKEDLQKLFNVYILLVDTYHTNTRQPLQDLIVDMLGPICGDRVLGHDTLFITAHIFVRTFAV